jgi:predicted double-glycine peptidase
MDFKLWLEQEEADVMVPVQPANQEFHFDCGAGALRAITDYFGIDKDHDELIKLCNSTKEKGTRPEELVRAAQALGLQARIVEKMTLDELKQYLLQKKPVICAVQAWGDEEEYHKLNDGHYIVAIGFGKGKIVFQDPSLKGSRGYIPEREFVKRWVDKEYGEKQPEHHLGIVIWDETSLGRNPNFKQKAKKIK